MKLLYCLKKQNENIENIEEINCAIFKPKIFRYTLPNEAFNFKQWCRRLLFYFTTRGKYRIFYLTNGDELLHTSYVLPKCRKFPFLKENDYEIGPCYTYPKHRGKGIYPAVLKSICKNIGENNTIFYMIVNENNEASIRGIEKAGFIKCGIVKTTRIAKKYIRVNE